MAAWRQRWGDRMSFPTPRPLRGLFERKFRLSMYPTYLNKIYTTEFLKAQKLFNIKVFLKVLVHRMSFINPPKIIWHWGLRGLNDNTSECGLYGELLKLSNLSKDWIGGVLTQKSFGLHLGSRNTSMATSWSFKIIKRGYTTYCEHDQGFPK